jgi:hypothetical protein
MAELSVRTGTEQKTGAIAAGMAKGMGTAAPKTDAGYRACVAAAREGMSLRKALGEMALLSADSLFGGPVQIRCDNSAASSLCKDRQEG